MYTFLKRIDQCTLANIYKHEEQQLMRFRSEFDNLFESVSKLHGWIYTVNLVRWIDTTYKWGGRPLDGYTATLQVDFTDNNNELIEIDESVCSFYENLTYIMFDHIRRKYRVCLNYEVVDLRAEVNQFIYSLEKSS